MKTEDRSNCMNKGKLDSFVKIGMVYTLSNIIIKDTVATFYVPKNDEQQVRYKASAGIY